MFACSYAGGVFFIPYASRFLRTSAFRRALPYLWSDRVRFGVMLVIILEDGDPYQRRQLDDDWRKHFPRVDA